jgi:hypothetical protein
MDDDLVQMERSMEHFHIATLKDDRTSVIYPFMMIWPPIFPAVKDRLARFAFLPLHNPSSPLNGVIVLQ